MDVGVLGRFALDRRGVGRLALDRHLVGRLALDLDGLGRLPLVGKPLDLVELGRLALDRLALVWLALERLALVECGVGMRAALVAAREVATSVRSEHLWFRSWSADDEAALHRLTGDRAVMRYVNDGMPMTREASDHLLDSMIRHRREHGFGHWALGRHGDDDVLGCVGLFVPEVTTPDVVELGVWLRPDVWGSGLGVEATVRVLHEAFDVLALDRVIATWHDDHPAAGRTMARLGFAPVGTLPDAPNVVLAELTRTCWFGE
jgi:ribosomal-protein-alanine N-acetyltransferase